MAHPTVDEFRKVLVSSPLHEVVKGYVFGGTPYVFRDRPETFGILRKHLREHLKVADENVTIVGSARIGFSLSPDTFPRQFSHRSDIDVLVVSETLFDDVWKTMLQWNYPHRYRLMGSDWNWSKQRRDDLYWGWFRPDRIRYDGLTLPGVLKPLRDISTVWFNTFRSLAQFSEFAAREVSGRLYRSWDHAYLYHADGLGQIRQIVKQADSRGK